MRAIVVLIPTLLALWACPSNAPDLTPIEEQPGSAEVVLLSSVNVADPKAQDQLIDGFYGLESGSWRWVAQRFVVALQPPESRTESAVLEMRFTIPEAIAQRFPTTTINVSVNGTDLGPESFDTPGDLMYSKEVPAAALSDEPARVEFMLENAIPAGEIDQRELALVVTSIALK